MSHQIPPPNIKGPTGNYNPTGIQFYNPSKDISNTSLLNPNSQSAGSLNNNPTSNKFQSVKQHNFKPTSMNEIKLPIYDAKGVANIPSTTYQKIHNEHGGSSKYIPINTNHAGSGSIMNKTINMGSTTTTSFISSINNKSFDSGMIKSSIQNINTRENKKQDPHPKQSKYKHFQTPKRLHRLSEPMNANLQTKTQNNVLNATFVGNFQNNDSPPAFIKERQKEKQSGFHKFKTYYSPAMEKFQSPILEKGQRQINYSQKGYHEKVFNPFRGVDGKSTSDENISGSKRGVGKGKKLTINDFHKIKQLGSGKYGKVFLARYFFLKERQKFTGFVCAVKMIEKKLLKDEEIVEQFIRELKIQMYLNHPNIVKMYGYFDDEKNIFIILQVGTGGQLYHQLKKNESMPENKVAGYIKQVCEAINEIHSLRIIHRDIKPENIVLHENVIKLCDFGWSVHQDNTLRTTFCGTPLYVCPQILKGKQYDQKIDIWSLGIMMYEMLVGQNPFKITKEQELIKIVKDKIQIPSYVYVSPEARNFLDKCLQKNPAQRVNIRELLNHQFFKKYPDKPQKKVHL